MKTGKSLNRIAKIYGIAVTLLMVLIFGGTIIGNIMEKGSGEFKNILNGCLHWYDDPTGFFFTYLVGYALVWWKPLIGGIIIVTGSIAVTITNIDNTGFLIFAVPTLLVGVIYIITKITNTRQ